MTRNLIVIAVLMSFSAPSHADRVRPTETLRLYQEAVGLMAEAQRERETGAHKSSTTLYERAHTLLVAARKRSPKFLKAIVADAEVLLHLERSNEAVPMLEALQKKDKRTWRIKHLLGLHLYRTGKKNRAVSLLEEVLRNRRGLFDAQFILARHFYQTARYGKALRYGRAYLKARPKDVGIRGLVGNCHLQRNELDKASIAFEKVLAIAPGNIPVRVNYGNVFFRKKEYRTAITIYERVLTKRTDIALVYFNLGSSHFSLSEWARSVQYFERSVELQPKRASGHYYLGVALVKQDKRSEAIPHLERASALDVKDPWPPVVLTEIAIHQQRLAQATDYAKVALDRAPKNGRVLLLNGVVARIRKQYARALEMLDRAITFSPRNAAAYAERGYVRHQMGHVDEAISDLETARTFNAREKRVRAWLPVALTLRAVSLLRAGDTKGAERQLRRALEIRPSLMEAAWNLALLHDRSGELAAAQRVVRSALQHQSKQSDLHLISAYLHVRNREYELAQTALRKTVNATDVGLRWLVQGAVHGHFHEYDAAIAALQQARVHGIEVGDALTMARLDRAVNLLRRKRTQAALVELQRMKSETRSAYEHIRVSLLAYAHLVADHGYGTALNLLKSITRHSAANRWGVESFLADVQLLIGYVRYRLGNERDAVPALKRHLSKKPRDAMARRLMAVTLDSLAERDHAARRFSTAGVREREAAKYAPNDARIRHNVACIQYGRGEYKEAASVFRSLQNHATVPEAPLNLALFLDDIAGKGAEAVALYRRYIESEGTAREIARRRLKRKERILGP